MARIFIIIKHFLKQGTTQDHFLCSQCHNWVCLKNCTYLSFATIAQNVGNMYYALYVVDESESVALLVM